MIEDLGEKLCNYCPIPEEFRGCRSALVNCEGSSCEEAYERYLEENTILIFKKSFVRL